MRNLGGAIGIALIDTVIYGRAPILAEEIGQRLKRGDVSVSPLVGIPPETVATAASRAIDAALIETVRPLVERAGLVGAINEAWAMLAAITALALLVLPFVVLPKGRNDPTIERLRGPSPGGLSGARPKPRGRSKRFRMV